MCNLPNIIGTGVAGVFHEGFSREGIGVYAESVNGVGLSVFCDSGTGILAGCDNGWSGEFATLRSRGVYVSVPAGQPGLQVASGTKSAVVATSRGTRALYSEEATAVWFAEYGFGHLQAGHAVVSIDPLFAETVNLREPYHVFIQLNDGGSEGAAVVNKTDSTFEVVELRNGRSAAEFSYRLVAKRLGHEHHRLEQAPWADNDPNLYPEKRSAWEEQRRLRRPQIPQVEVPPPCRTPSIKRVS